MSATPRIEHSNDWNVPNARRNVTYPTKSLTVVAVLVLLVALLGAPSHAADCGDAFAKAYVGSFKSVKPIPYGNEIHGAIDNYDKARCHQNRVIALFKANGRTVIGYKVAASSRAGQRQAGSPGPIPGVLFRGTMLPNGVRINRRSGVSLIYEADMLVRVGSDDIMKIRTKMDALRALDAVIPFIEVGDRMLGRGVKMTGKLLYAMNAGSRFGVAGKPIGIKPNRAYLSALATMRVTLKGKAGKVLTQARGTAILDHPLNSVLFLVEEAKRRGWNIRKGHLLSLGAFGRNQPAEPGREGHLTYEGLPGGAATVSVYFE